MSLFIGLSALRSSQTGLDVISQNIANANTRGYHRQNVHLQSLNDQIFRGRRIGSGVSILDLERVRYAVIEAFLTETTSDVQRARQRLQVDSQIESRFLPGPGSLQEVLDGLFNSIRSLSSAPSDTTTREQVVQSGSQLASQFRNVAQGLHGIRESIRSQLQIEISVLNSQIRELSVLNQEIIAATAISGPPNGLLDARDELINSIAEKLDVSRIESTDGNLSLTFGNFSIQQSITQIEFSLVESADGSLALAFGTERQPLQVTSGRFAALIESYNQIVPNYSAKLDELAASLIQQFDRTHATGIGIAGPFDRLVGNRPVQFPNAVLHQAGTAFEIGAGDLHISITDPSGNRRTATISIDPQNDSLVDIVNQINSVSNLSASINSQSNQIQIHAAPGFHFDFTGALETVPALNNFNGTSRPSLAGFYQGPSNNQFQFEIIGDGNVGITPDLSLRVTDQDGNLIGNFNIGHGYEAGKSIPLAEGVEISFSSGTVLAGDTLSTPVIATPDETGFLVALGLNSFFTGNDALSIGVDPLIANDSRRFASSLTGDTAETNQILQFIELANSRQLSDGRFSFSEYLIELTTEIGVTVQTSQRLSSNLEILLNQYQRERDSISGVDVNEEFVRLTQFQRSYEAAVRVIQTSQSVLDELFAIIR